MKHVERRRDLHAVHERRAISEAALEPIKRVINVAEPRVSHRNVECESVGRSRSVVAQLCKLSARIAVFARYRKRVREVGWGPIALLGDPDEPALAGVPREPTVLHWHGDTFDLPPGATWLASTPLCPHQAFRVGPRAFGLQFHVEADAALARRWAVEDADFVRAARGPDGPAAVIAESDQLADAARVSGDRLIRNIIGCLLS